MIINIEEAETIYDQNGVRGKQLYMHKNIEYVHLLFEIAGKTDTHVQNLLMTFFVLKGQAKVVVDGQEMLIKAGQLIEIEPGKSRQWINTGNEALEILVGKISA